MFVHIWRMRARKKKAEDYENFGRRVTLPILKRIDGFLDAHFLKVYESRKPEYLWVCYWRDQQALEAARTNPAWREQIKRFEAGDFYKTVPLELLCETLASTTAASKKPGQLRTRKSHRVEKPEVAENHEESEEEAEEKEHSSRGFVASTPEGE